MANEPYISAILSEDDVRRYVRFEITLEEMIGTNNIDLADIVVATPYDLMSEDICEALRFIRDRGVNGYEFWRYYYRGFSGEIPSIAAAISIPEDDQPANAEKPWTLLPMGEKRIVNYLLDKLDEIAERSQTMENVPIRDYFPLDDLVSMSEMAGENAAKELKELHFTDEIKKNFVVEADNHMSALLEREEYTELFRQYVDELCAKNDYDVLLIKAYALFGGNEIYPCDWKKSRELLEKAFSRKQEADVANSLAYIHYYGWTNDRQPQYKEAFQYYVLASQYGSADAKFKLADMYANGLGTFKSPRTAYILYSKLYDELRQDFIDGEYDNKYADAAMRLAACFENGFGVEADPMQAYFIYLNAQTAIDLRMKFEMQGDEKIKEIIDNGVKRLMNYFGITAGEIWQGRDLEPLRNVLEDGRVNIEFKRITARGAAPDSLRMIVTKPDLDDVDSNRDLMVMIPAVGYAKLQQAMAITAIGPCELSLGGRSSISVTDFVITEEGEIRFYLYRTMVGSLRATSFDFRPSKINRPVGQEEEETTASAIGGLMSQETVMTAAGSGEDPYAGEDPASEDME